jgi:hypothetical protein
MDFFLPALFVLVKSLILIKIGQIVGSSIFGMFIFLLFAFRLYYFGLSDDYLAIKLHNIFWFKKFYRLSDIREIVFETHPKMPVCLRVITNDFESKMYPASTIWSKKWMQLKEDLESKGIKVRNECVSYEPFEFKLFQ